MRIMQLLILVCCGYVMGCAATQRMLANAVSCIPPSLLEIGKKFEACEGSYQGCALQIFTPWISCMHTLHEKGERHLLAECPFEQRTL